MRKYISIFMIFVICLIITMSRYNIAYAMPVEPLPPPDGWVPEIIEGGKGALNKAVSGEYGPTVAYVLGAILSLYLVGETTYLGINDLQDPTTEFYNIIHNETTPVIKSWFDSWAEKAKNVNDTTKSLLDAILLGDGDNINLMDYIFPVQDNITVTIPKTLKSYMGNYIQNFTGLLDLAPGTYDRSIAIYKNRVMLKLGEKAPNLDNMPTDLFKVHQGFKKGFVVVDSINNGTAIFIDNVYDDEYYEPNIRVTKSYDTREKIIMNRGTSYYYNVDYKGVINQFYITASKVNTYELNTLYGTITDSNKLQYFDIAMSDILYTNIDLELTSTQFTEILYLENNEQLFRIDESEIIKSPEFDADAINNIYVNDYLAYTIRNIESDAFTNTDDYIKPIIVADEVARTYNSKVLDNELDVPDAPVEPELPFPIEWLWNGLKAIFEWLFVPSELAIENAINNVKEKIENQAGLLTYPLTLVIRFLMSVNELDADAPIILNIPEIKFKDKILYSGYAFDVRKFINDNELNNMQSLIYTIGNFIMIIGLLNMAWKKGDEIIRGN